LSLGRQRFTIKQPTAAEKEAGVRGDIAHAFSEPVSVDEPQSDYIPTQILGEAFRERGYDGIMYKSLLDERGKIIALFEVAAAELINCCLFETKSIILSSLKPRIPISSQSIIRRS
jgi:hypothetical protein